MKRGGFFARIAQAAAVPVAIAVGRVAPAASPTLSAGATLVTGSLQAAPLDDFGAPVYYELPAFAFEYADGSTSLIENGTATLGMMIARATPGVVRVLEYVYRGPETILLRSHPVG